jgi:hypothetical protein
LSTDTKSPTNTDKFDHSLPPRLLSALCLLDLDRFDVPEGKVSTSSVSQHHDNIPELLSIVVNSSVRAELAHLRKSS